MTSKIKRVAQAVTLALALGAGADAMATQGVKFDPTGTGTDAGISIVTIDWIVDNAFCRDCQVGRAGTGTRAGDMLIQARAGTIKDSFGNIISLGSQELTVMFSRGTNTTIAGSTMSWADDTAVGFFRMFIGVNTSNPVTGLGYGDNNADGIADAGKTLIASGTGSIDTTKTNDYTATAAAIVPLDGGGAPDDQPGVDTQQGSGGVTYNISIASMDSLYFLSALTSMDFTGQQRTAFNSTSPSDQVVGYNIVGNLNRSYGADLTAGKRVNNYDCGAPVGGVARVCGYHMQFDGSSTVFDTFVPEPGSLALLGLGLGAIGLGARRRRIA